MAAIVKKHIVLILCILAFASPVIAMQFIDVFYYSSLIGWIVGFILIITSLIIVTKSPDETEEENAPIHDH